MQDQGSNVDVRKYPIKNSQAGLGSDEQCVDECYSGTKTLEISSPCVLDHPSKLCQHLTIKPSCDLGPMG